MENVKENTLNGQDLKVDAERLTPTDPDELDNDDAEHDDAEGSAEREAAARGV